MGDGAVNGDDRSGRGPSRSTRAARDELRWRRQRAIVELALEIVTAEGYGSLTMQRLADELECGIASVYRLFPSRDALIAELQHQALDVLHGAWLAGASHLDDDLRAAGHDDVTSALARAVGAAWFWVVAEDRYLPQVELSRRLFVDPTIVLPDEQASRIVPAAMRLLDHGRRCLDDAATAGAIRDGASVERAVVLMASITGISLSATLGRFDAVLFEPRRLARQAIADDFTAWGADPDRLAAAFDVVAATAAAGRLVPSVERRPTRTAD